MLRHFMNFRRSPITKINFRMGSLGNIKKRSYSKGLFLFEVVDKAILFKECL